MGPIILEGRGFVGLYGRKAGRLDLFDSTSLAPLEAGPDALLRQGYGGRRPFVAPTERRRADARRRCEAVISRVLYSEWLFERREGP
jgi:hypothetical protein